MYPIGAKLEVNCGLYRHVSSYIGNGYVLHNSRERGEELVPLHIFSEGKKISVASSGVVDMAAFLHRVRQVLANPQAYNLIFNNCEDTASRVRDGVASSPQLFSYGLLVLLATGVFIYSRGARA